MPDLVLSGSPTFGASFCTIDSPDRVICPRGDLLNTKQMWVAIRFKTAWASTDANEHTFFRWGPNSNEELFVQYGAAAGAAGCGRDAGGGGGQVTINPVPAFAVGDTLTYIAAWATTEVKFSIDGAAFTTAANAVSPAIDPNHPWDIGQRGYSATGFVNSDVFWFAAGLGTLTDGNAATIHALGDTDPGIGGFPTLATFFWAATDASYVAAYENLRFSAPQFPKAIFRPPVPVPY